MKIAIAQINPIIGDFNYNCQRIQDVASRARQQKCDLVVFPELAISGYPPRDLLEKPDFVDANMAALNHLIANINGVAVIIGSILKNPNPEGIPLYNSAILLENGQIRYQAHKRLLPTYDVFDEMRYFEPGSDFSAYPFQGQRIGLTICEDVWNETELFEKRLYHMNPVERLVAAGADLLINVSASPFHSGKREFRWKLLSTIAKKYHIPVIHANQVGGNDSVLFDGISVAFDADGRMVARAFDFCEDMVIYDMATNTGDIHEISQSEPESIYKALVMGTRDYLHKCGFSKAVVGLSGGIDSALTVAIAVDALGKENVLGIFMPSQFTSKDNYEDTRQLADNLGIELITVPIDDMYQAFIQYISPELGSNPPGITEQNIQARIRGTILMAFSNKHGSLVLSTGNKSEMAVGYCTLYGDMNGGLSVISDVPKTMVYRISEYVNQQAPRIPQRILEKAPSAELKPDQKDQDELPAYEILDPILKAYVEDLKRPTEIMDMGFRPEVVADVIRRVERNEYKRHQAAPGLKVTSKAFGYGRRYPLAKRYWSQIISPR